MAWEAAVRWAAAVVRVEEAAVVAWAAEAEWQAVVAWAAVGEPAAAADSAVRAEVAVSREAAGAAWAGGGGMGGGMPQMKATVRWESAQPMYDAMKKARVAETANYYVVSLTGLRLMGGRREGQDPKEQAQRQQAMLARIKESTTIERKGKDPINAEVMQSLNAPQGMVLMFGFQKGSQPIALEDKEVTFHCKAGPMEIKAKFALKDMVYNGKLEL